jgi:hypothetical protein
MSIYKKYPEIFCEIGQDQYDEDWKDDIAELYYLMNEAPIEF